MPLPAVVELFGGRLFHHEDDVAVRVAQHKHQWGAECAHWLRIDVDAADSAKPKLRAV